MVKLPGTNTSRLGSSPRDSASPKWTPDFLSRELSFSSSTSTMPVSFLPTPRQSTARSCHPSNLLTSPMKATSKITWGPDSLSTQMAVLSSNKRRQLTIVWSCLAWALHPKMSKPMILWPNPQRFFMTTKMGQTGSMHGTTGQSFAASTTCRQ